MPEQKQGYNAEIKEIDIMSQPFCSGLHQNALISTASFAYQGTGCLVPHLCPVEKVFKLSEEET